MIKSCLAAIPRLVPPSLSKELEASKSTGSLHFARVTLFLKKLFSECCSVCVNSGSLKLSRVHEPTDMEVTVCQVCLPKTSIPLDGINLIVLH